MSDIWTMIPGERDCFLRWWTAYAATLKSKPTPIWRELAWQGWLASKEA